MHPCACAARRAPSLCTCERRASTADFACALAATAPPPRHARPDLQVQFEWWAIEALDHSYDAVVANAWTARAFVDAVRRGNTRRFPSADLEARALIYNFDALYTGNGAQPANATVPGTQPGYLQTYFFDAATYVAPV